MTIDVPSTADEAPLSELRVLELSTGIAASYCGKLFADAGADVVKLEPPLGDPLRRWTASRTALLDGENSALFDFLNTGKRSVLGELRDPAGMALAERADVVIVDEGASPTLDGLSALHDRIPRTTIVSITPFGLTGPYPQQGVRATEFVLQALCGSIASRGLPEEPPLQAGGRIGEWISGCYGAVAAAAAVHGRHGSGHGTLVDLSMYESMVTTMGGLSAVAADVLGPRHATPGRSIELPSIEPTADGFVGFCTITAQQFGDFLAMIDRADLLDDPHLARAPSRMKRRAEFTAIVTEWTTRHTTAEIIELAEAMRIPVAPLGRPDRIESIDHFVAREVFVENPAGFRQPRVPYRIGDFRGVPLTPAPQLGEDTIDWPARPIVVRGSRPPSDRRRPLRGLRVLDLTAFWAGPSATLLLGSLGADVVKIEGVRRPDAMRYSGAMPPSHQRWWETSSIFLASNSNKRGLSLELSKKEAQELALRLAAQCDVVIENFSPRVLANLGLEWDALHAANPRAVVVRMPAFGLDGPWRDRVGFAQTMEQASGMAWLTGPADGPPLIPRGPCDPIAGLHAAFATLAALAHREHTGSGALVESTMVEAALNVAAEAIVEHTAYGTTLMRDGNRGPVAVPQGVYRCHGDDEWIAMAVTSDDEWLALCSAIERPDLARDPMLAAETDRRAAHDRIDEAILRWSGGRSPADAVASLRDSGIAAGRVTGGADLFEDAQLISRGFFEHVKHPVAGEIRMPGLPFQIVGETRAWVSQVAPTIGEHNHDILVGLLGLSEDSLDELAKAGVIGTRPAGL